MQQTAMSVLEAQHRRFRTPEQAHRAYQEFREAAEPIIREMVKIRSLATPHLHLQAMPDGSWKIVSDPDEGLPENLRQLLRLHEEWLRALARAHGFYQDEM